MTKEELRRLQFNIRNAMATNSRLSLAAFDRLIELDSHPYPVRIVCFNDHYEGRNR